MGGFLAKLFCTFPDASAPMTLEARHEQLVALHAQQAAHARRFIPLLVLGLPGSGKSLLVCQLAASYRAPPHLLYGAAADDATAAAAMRDATIDSARALALAALRSGEPFGTPGAAAAAELLAARPRGCALRAEVAEAVVRLWGGGGRAVALAWDAVAPTACADNVNYLVKRAWAQSARGFAPSAEDRLRLHLPTRFPMRTLLRERGDKNILHVVELPGRCVFEDFVGGGGVGGGASSASSSSGSGGGSSGAQLAATCAQLGDSALGLVFCAALSDFDRTLHAPSAQGLLLTPPRNQLLCALDAWGAVATSPHFKHSHITLLLTKLDAFMDKLQTTDLRHPGSAAVPPRFLDYRGGADPSAALSYLEARFHERAAGRALPARIQAINLLDAKRVAVLCRALKDHARQIQELKEDSTA